MCELAQMFSPSTIECLWDQAAVTMVESMPVWGHRRNPFVEQGFCGKKLACEMALARNAFNVCGKPGMLSRWSPWIIETSTSSIKVLPHPNGFYERQSEGAECPDRASIALAVGTVLGQPLVRGMKLLASGPVDDNLWFGVEADLDGEGWVSISFAPFSGKCFIELAGQMFQTQALPSASHTFPLEVYVWIHITEEGGIRFLRQVRGGELEDVGLVPPEWLPDCITCYFASLDVWPSDVEGAVEVSIQHAGVTFPTDVPISGKRMAELSTNWTIVEESDGD